MTTFVDNSTVIQAVWLNSVDRAVTQAIGTGTNAPTTTTEVKVNLGLDQVTNTSDANKPISADVQVALDLKASLSGSETLTNKTLDSTCNVSSASGQPLSFRNLLINGDFSINQRTYVSGTNTGASNTYTLDRWRIPVSGKNITFAASGIGNLVTIPASNSIEQVIEGANIAGGTYVINWEGTATCEVNAVPVAKGGTFSLPANTDAIIEFITGTVSKPQVESGSIATPFENRPIGTELAMCQRYYERFQVGHMCHANTANFDIYGTVTPFFVQKRISPTITQISDGNLFANVNAGAQTTLQNVNGCIVYRQSLAVGQLRFSGEFSASAEL